VIVEALIIASIGGGLWLISTRTEAGKRVGAEVLGEYNKNQITGGDPDWTELTQVSSQQDLWRLQWWDRNTGTLAEMFISPDPNTRANLSGDHIIFSPYNARHTAVQNILNRGGMTWAAAAGASNLIFQRWSV
jgi:hypothetical protein